MNIWLEHYLTHIINPRESQLDLNGSKMGLRGSRECPNSVQRVSKECPKSV